jgi:hypothetical protein
VVWQHDGVHNGASMMLSYGSLVLLQVNRWLAGNDFLMLDGPLRGGTNAFGQDFPAAGGADSGNGARAAGCVNLHSGYRCGPLKLACLPACINAWAHPCLHHAYCGRQAVRLLPQAMLLKAHH